MGATLDHALRRQINGSNDRYSRHDGNPVHGLVEGNGTPPRQMIDTLTAIVFWGAIAVVALKVIKDRIKPE
jgi:hypothetical protein